MRAPWLAILLFTLSGCGYWPADVHGRWSILTASADEPEIDIRDLPLADYPKLSKFQCVKVVHFGTGVTDAQLEALAAVDLPTLQCISAVGSSGVTDAGVRALARLPSLTKIYIPDSKITDASCRLMVQAFHLEEVTVRGASITDDGCRAIAKSAILNSAGVEGCPHVSLAGLQALAVVDSLTEFSFTSDGLTTQQVCDLLASFKHLKYCQVFDLHDQLDREAVRAVAKQHGISLTFPRWDESFAAWVND